MTWTKDQNYRGTLGFDPYRYLAVNQDILSSARPNEDPRDTAARHWREFGQYENRMTQPINPGDEWDAEYYGQQFIAPSGGYQGVWSQPAASSAPASAGGFSEADLQAAIQQMYAPPPAQEADPSMPAPFGPGQSLGALSQWLSSDGRMETGYDPLDGRAGNTYDPSRSWGGRLVDALGVMGGFGALRGLYDGFAGLTGLPHSGGPVGSYNERNEPGAFSGPAGSYSGDSGAGGGNYGTGPGGVGVDSGMADSRDAFANGGIVPAGAYVIPADIVSAIGNGSTDAGADIMYRKYGGTLVDGPGDGRSDEVITRGPQGALALSRGEVVIPPKGVKKAGGPGALESLVVNTRKKHRDKLATIPKPAR